MEGPLGPVPRGSSWAGRALGRVWVLVALVRGRPWGIVGAGPGPHNKAIICDFHNDTLFLAYFIDPGVLGQFPIDWNLKNTPGTYP